LGAVTSRIRLATLASSVAYRNPAHLAKIAAGVDLISRSRLTLGIGAGWFETEYRQYGWEFPERSAVRIRQLEEAVRLILAMWSEKRTTFHGKYFHVEDAILEPKPRSRPPVMIAGGGEQLTLRVVARRTPAMCSAIRKRLSGSSLSCATIAKLNNATIGRSRRLS
jgi:alkanesulfonate monooxygenase SsuD/methylene tetrahydromethanopterin reductase-like flavin-dependent oxidoreductase (luciferase family)